MEKDVMIYMRSTLVISKIIIIELFWAYVSSSKVMFPFSKMEKFYKSALKGDMMSTSPPTDTFGPSMLSELPMF